VQPREAGVGRVSHWSHSSSVEVAVAEVRTGLCLLVGRGHNHHTALPTSVVCQLGLDACAAASSQAVQSPKALERESRGDENLRVDTSEVATGQARREGARSVEPDAGIPPQRARKHTVTGGDCPTAQDTMGWLELRLVWLSTSKTSSQAQRWRSGRSARCV
jgi:hypothetical protein